MFNPQQWTQYCMNECSSIEFCCQRKLKHKTIFVNVSLIKKKLIDRLCVWEETHGGVHLHLEDYFILRRIKERRWSNRCEIYMRTYMCVFVCVCRCSTVLACEAGYLWIRIVSVIFSIKPFPLCLTINLSRRSSLTFHYRSVNKVRNI